MIIHCVELGSHYWPQTRRDGAGDYDVAHSCYFNSTGFARRDGRACLPASWGAHGNKVHRCWSEPGIVRFNAEGFPLAAMPADLNGINMLSNGIEMWNGQKRLLMRRAVARDVPIDAYLVVVRSKVCGRIAFLENWRSAGVRVVSASSNKGLQETLILMPPDGVITTALGSWQIRWRSSAVSRKRAYLELMDERDTEKEREGRLWKTHSM